MENTLIATVVLIPVALLLGLLPIALVILLQVWLCKRGKWPGLILPGLSLAVSLLLVLSLSAFTYVGSGALQVTDEHGHTVYEEHHQPQMQIQNGSLTRVGMLFVISNIPTAILGGIWLHYKKGRSWKEDLHKMNIQDLD